VTPDERTELQRLAPDVVAALAEDILVLNDLARDDRAGGGDIDCAARDVRRAWTLRLREWQLCQALWYDVAATYFVFVRGDETLALDVLDDPQGLGTYGFSTEIFGEGRESGSLASEPDRAAYLTLKRVAKGQSDPVVWREVRRLAAVQPGDYREKLANAAGRALASEIWEALSAGRGPEASTVLRWQKAIRRHRGRDMRRRLSSFRLSVRRAQHRLAHPTGMAVVLVGPDGVGKSSVAEALPATCGQLFRRASRMHFRPSVLPRPGAVARRAAPDAKRPHARRTHGRVLSSALVGYYWLDFLLGYLLKVAPQRARTGLVVIERGFLDLAVDPTRYRLDVSPRLVRTLSRLLPGPDLTVLLGARRELVSERKAELEGSEIARQIAAWRQVAGSTAVEVDASMPLPDVLAEVRRHVASSLASRTAARLDDGWAALPSSTRPRLYVPRGPRSVARSALRLMAPSKRSSRLFLRAGEVAAGLGAMRLLPRRGLPVEVSQALARHLPPDCTVAAARAVHPGRYHALVLERSGAPAAIAKIVSDDLGRARLRAEASALTDRASGLEKPLRAPSVIAADDEILVLEWVPHVRRRQPWVLPEEVAHALGAFFASGAVGEGPAMRGPAHGDTAPWNLLHSGAEWVLVDWEVSLDDAPPFFDVYHYLVQAHAFLGRPGRDELLRGIRGDGWIGRVIAAYADGAGVPLSLADVSFERYLSHTSRAPTMRDMSARSIRVRHDLLSGVKA
jgi:hypothetical protein